MRMVGTIAVGIVALLASPAQADSVINSEQVSWQGCDYTIKVLLGDDPYADTPYTVSIQSAVVSPDTCSLTPRTVNLVGSVREPRIAIAASAEGLAIAYSYEEYARFSWGRNLLRIHHLNPSTLGSVKVAELEGIWLSGTGPWAPTPFSLSWLTLYPGSLEVHGFLEGSTNAISSNVPATSWPPPLAQGNRFAAIYSDFFGATLQPPQIVTY
ncbi:hypothetical protein D187_009991 [Cystobacter fuscus DSM 2262]|uniref:Lipoprotein n=1 Tax=Cystobacter fuscus (strain ATCC 25194 / DSM 2262 / NBRC 100088 / M29) TaxID=1242864 RepID=S9PI75_CYSF2|nr:hypothetical protein [Cystobacter fuscus]EPX62087.1 hypothetical protein D187_009991 [Cystobacter fuscus DSM 2262]